MPQSPRQSSASALACDGIASRPPGPRLAGTMLTVLFFGLLGLYVWLVVQPCLIYSCGTITDFPVFYKGRAFFHDSLSHPAGLLNYISAFLSQLFYYSWAGAIVITLQAWAITACTGRLFRRLELPGARWLGFVPALLVLAAYAQYTYRLPTIMGALAVSFGAWLYVSLADNSPSTVRNPLWRAVPVFVVLGIIIYVVAGSAFVPFAAICGIYELLYRRRYVWGVICLLLGAVLPYVAGVLIYRVSILDAYTDVLPLSWRIRGWPGRDRMIGLIYVLYVYPIAGVGLGGVWRILASLWSGRKTTAPVDHAKSAKPSSSFVYRVAHSPVLRWTAGSLAVLAAGVAVALVPLDSGERARLQVHYYTCRRMWPEVLNAARGCPTDYFAMNAVDRALWHTGRFSDDLFLYPQHPKGLLDTGEEHDLTYWSKFDTQVDLGLVCVAEKHFTECMETFGEQPMILQRLAMMNMVRGAPETARIYLGALSKTLFYGRWAKDYLSRLDADPDLSDDRQVQDLRALCLQKDNTAFFYAREESLAALAGQGNANRMAYDYLMAWYLQTKQVEKLARSIDRLREFGYTTVSPLYQEAMAIYAYPRNQADKYPISPQVRSRFEDFSRTFNKYRDKAAAFGELAENYRHSYLFYYMYASIER